MQKKIFAVILSGCGHQDGAEIHEATLTLWAIHKNGADFQCYAPDIRQHHVLNHITGEEMSEKRNVLIESARIARGKIASLATFNPNSVDGLVIPGGFGAAKNLSSYAFDGANCTVNKDVAGAIKGIHDAGKPIGALCIAPVILAKVLGNVTLTIGQDQGTADNIAAMGAHHQPTMQGEIAIDRDQKIVSTPCYMLNSRIDQIAEGADKLIRAMLEMMN
ncbi:isoprenoid biosynthesis glyoxalase ElbB [Desulfobulbus oligotrophicus]|jgi:enhancing lycopene biosynthesis protein 2|uniref:Isoprenoid biosynthesis glyoxalase ElbB n=1 Tax=Desulfobulbus oligotrophicus TaxID=1909699 RepID=A0A7T5VBB2_9BACT|nr:isoprenoid biosynthesis glyoxalase ElbB [Desulfobulbus oligotrophicus]MDY0391262.1 isoprenoid biosynthesis glyoxalase ElbB [Desulfobulbus oligotrophicus]QQG64727.1 isoprenoid biosynthesis glyoxalase ElbB [Desulfobulbus oligotrophicus]